MPSSIKQQLYTLCHNHLETQEAGIKKIIADAQEAANNETKSTAGDKYETAREMMQQEINLALSRLSEVQQQKAVLARIDASVPNEVAAPGALVITNTGNYYIAVSIGKLTMGTTIYYAISAASPLGSQLAGHKAGDELTFNGKKITISSVS